MRGRTAGRCGAHGGGGLVVIDGAATDRDRVVAAVAHGPAPGAQAFDEAQWRAGACHGLQSWSRLRTDA